MSAPTPTEPPSSTSRCESILHNPVTIMVLEECGTCQIQYWKSCTNQDGKRAAASETCDCTGFRKLIRATTRYYREAVCWACGEWETEDWRRCTHCLAKYDGSEVWVWVELRWGVGPGGGYGSIESVVDVEEVKLEVRRANREVRRRRNKVEW